MIVRHTFSSRIGKIVDINGVPHRIVRQVHWAKACDKAKDEGDEVKWRYSQTPPWKYFYYEVQPVEQKTEINTSSGSTL